jgi:hypothetical protein
MRSGDDVERCVELVEHGPPVSWFDVVEAAGPMVVTMESDRTGAARVLLLRAQANRHVMQAWVLLAVTAVILATLSGAIVSVGLRWISEEFAQQVISLVLTATLSGLGGAVAWAFHEARGERDRRQG